MPTYYARGVTVRLGVNPLADTITPSITLKKGDVAKKQCEKPEKELLNSHLLPEQRVDFPGDEHGFELNWLGDAPFMQARVGDSLFEGATSSNAVQTAPLANSARLRRQPAKESYKAYGYEPLALSLHVMTSDTTFVSGMDRQNKLQLKIEVFFNGQLSSCLFLPPYEIRSNTKTHHQVFAGYRIDYLAERPWVILPPHTAADGSPVKSDKLLSAKQRWKDISTALGREASQRGTDSQGNIPPSSHFLGALATSRMPDQVVAWQKPGCRHFGVIDVVITAGEGRKVTSGATYLTRPQRFTDENFPLSNVGGFDEDADGESDSDYEPLPKRQALNHQFPAMSCGPEYIQAPLSHNKSVFQSIQETPMCQLSSTPPQFPSTETPPFGPDRSIHELSRFSHDPLLSSERGPASYMKHSSNTDPTVHMGAASIDFQSQVPMRFVGKGGVMLVDYEWSIAQHIAVNEHPAGHCGSNVPQKSSQNASAQSRKAPYELTKDGNKRASSTRATNGQSIPQGHRSDIKDGGIMSLDSVVRTDSALPSQKVEGNARDVAHSPLPQRRTTAATTILGVQGPKAITFLYDDPEAMIREEKRNARRSKSPIKPKDKPSTTRKFKTLAPDEIAAPAKDMGALSSPLSSLATTPEVEYEPKAKSIPIILSSSAETGPLPQVDGSPAHKIDTISSPTAANIARSAPQFSVPPASSTPRNSPSPNAKKRKNESGRYLAKQPRSPDRLKTTSNPLLNRDCVIAFAESQDKESERGVLRQIKSERQGVFAEVHVVFATRFYVAGN
ncbi:hypothetical protein SNOG_14277 [Parastagonospora nodorum SN15]|uniref:Uncharacterized protein n=1 Tax=Phaeosphaeria nodorum (strain SN15 / ATCC MYA-4574 / FGSC 10173) TaxID=321614 RepID=Q0U2B2_PHANO|nr:hypothetical protein SNOG_14277 [Parastagonospora nodorum SN15]EAT78514.2 hypothetical protein SNOG_14277 [Parastagonospora nodorum SN15]